MQSQVINPGELTLTQLQQLDLEHAPIELSHHACEMIDKSYGTLNELIAKGDKIYGVNTGFGKLASAHIPDDKLGELQYNLIVSHAAGTGELLDDSVVAKILLIKINALSRGYSGVRRELVDALVTLYNQQYFPCVPSQGSVGASGDLAPLAHLSVVLLGLGEARHQQKVVTGQELLNQLNLNLMPLRPKEGLALLNGTQVSTAIALEGLFKACHLFEAGLVSGALSVEAALGSHRPFDDNIHSIRSNYQQQVATSFRALLVDSELCKSHAECDRVQDPYSLRCQPQVMGPVLGQIEHAANILQQEVNAVTDNPLIFSETKEVLSGGNFHAQNVAFAADGLALALAEIGSLSERRIALLMDKHLSNLPQFLIDDPGLNSGLMIAQVTAAALVHENKQLASPSSVDSIPTSANQEDHVSMATYASRRLLQMCDNLAGILAVEYLAACQGIDFRKPLKTSIPLQAVHDRVRLKVPFYQQDRMVSADLNTIKNSILKGEFSLSQFGINSTQFWQ